MRVRGFRNLKPQEVRFREPLALFYGANAQGKTNLLEAIYLLGTTRSFRENRLEHMVCHGLGEALVEGDPERSGVEHVLAVEITPSRKSYRKDGAQVGLASYLQTMPVVVLSAEDRGLVDGLPQQRRQFLDAAAVWRRPQYLEDLLLFGGCVRQRNAILRDYAPARRAELDAWDRTFDKMGHGIQRERSAVVGRINGLLEEMTPSLSAGEELKLVYRSSGGDDLGKAMTSARADEIRRGFSLVGPQRDAVELLLNGRPLAAYGSSGQERTALWMLKLAVVRLLRDELGETPIFLLDDVEAELDESRIGELVRLTGGAAQVVMTATRPIRFDLAGMQSYRVEEGYATETEGRAA